VVAIKKGSLVVHAGGRPVLVDQFQTDDANHPASPVEQMLVADDGRLAMIRCLGPATAHLGVQRVQLVREPHQPVQLTIHREVSQPLSWWCAGDPQHQGNTLRWSDGTTLHITQGSITKMDPKGFRETKMHYAGMQYADPHPMVYPTITAQPNPHGMLEMIIRCPAGTR